MTEHLDERWIFHCSFAHQVQPIADLLYPRRADVVLLRIDSWKVEAEIRFENLDGGENPSPHIYGHFATEAVVRADPVQLDSADRLLLEPLISDRHVALKSSSAVVDRTARMVRLLRFLNAVLRPGGLTSDAQCVSRT